MLLCEMNVTICSECNLGQLRVQGTNICLIMSLVATIFYFRTKIFLDSQQNIRKV
jgi:K+ transporter